MVLKAFEIGDGTVDWFYFLILFTVIPSYLKDYLPVLVATRHNQRNSVFRRFVCHTNYFNNSFLPYCVDEWNNLDPILRELETVSLFKKHLLHFIRPKPMPVYDLMDPPGFKLLTHLRVNLSHLREHKFRHNFGDTLVPFRNCSLSESESTNHFLLRSTSFTDLRKILLGDIIDLIGSISNLPHTKLVTITIFIFSLSLA